MPHSSISHIFVLPEASGQGQLCVVTLSASVANGKSQLSHLLLHSKPNDAKISCAFHSLTGQPVAVLSKALATLCSVEVRARERGGGGVIVLYTCPVARCTFACVHGSLARTRAHEVASRARRSTRRLAPAPVGTRARRQLDAHTPSGPRRR